jgi:hypothetical protein
VRGGAWEFSVGAGTSSMTLFPPLPPSLPPSLPQAGPGAQQLQLQQLQQQQLLQQQPPPIVGIPSRALLLKNMFDPAEEKDDGWELDIQDGTPARPPPRPPPRPPCAPSLVVP